MASYTEIYVNVDLKEEIPAEIIETLRQICNGIAPPGFPIRTGCLFGNNSYYTPRTSVRHLTYDHNSEQWSFLGKGDTRNNNNEIQYFFNWIMPWVEGSPGDFVGYHRYEESQSPTLVFIPEPSRDTINSLGKNNLDA